MRMPVSAAHQVDRRGKQEFLVNQIIKTSLLIGLTTIALLSLGCGVEDTASSGIDTTTLTTPSPQLAGWYASIEVRVTANDGSVYEHTTAGIFGELVESSDTLDKHDIAAYGPAILQVVFLQDGRDNTIGYFSDYQHFDENRTTKKVWTFQVRNDKDVDLSGAPISLSLQGVYEVFYASNSDIVSYEVSDAIDTDKVRQLNLIDVDNQIKYTVEELSSANLTMDNLHVRTFRWVLGLVDANDYTLLSSSARAQTFNKMSLSTFEPITNPSGTFGLPPQ